MGISRHFNILTDISSFLRFTCLYCRIENHINLDQPSQHSEVELLNSRLRPFTMSCVMSPGKHELTNASQEDARPNNKQIKTGIHKPENFSTFEHYWERPFLPPLASFWSCNRLGRLKMDQSLILEVERVKSEWWHSVSLHCFCDVVIGASTLSASGNEAYCNLKGAQRKSVLSQRISLVLVLHQKRHHTTT